MYNPCYNLSIEITENYKIKANMMTKSFNSMEGVESNPIEGAMYGFPTLKLPQKAIDEAKK